MKVIGVLSQKGGSGKTTISIHLAVSAAMKGLKVAIIDTDPQKSAVAWGNARDVSKELPVVAECAAFRVKEAIEAVENDGFDLVVIDAPPYLSPEVTHIADVSDFILIPVRPTALDLQTAGRSAAVANASGKDFGFVLNGCAPRIAEVPESLEILASLGGVVCPTTLGERRSFARSLGMGQAVTEFDPKGKASAEIHAVSEWIDRIAA